MVLSESIHLSSKTDHSAERLDDVVRVVPVGDDVALARELLDALEHKPDGRVQHRAAEYSVAAAARAYRDLLGL